MHRLCASLCFVSPQFSQYASIKGDRLSKQPVTSSRPLGACWLVMSVSIWISSLCTHQPQNPMSISLQYLFLPTCTIDFGMSFVQNMYKDLEDRDSFVRLETSTLQGGGASWFSVPFFLVSCFYLNSCSCLPHGGSEDVNAFHLNLLWVSHMTADPVT